jgi:hypothetical protein
MIPLKRRLTAQERFENKLQKFLRESEERLMEAGHKKHTKIEVMELKAKNNNVRKLKNKHKNY